MLYTDIINRHSGTPNKTSKKDTMSLDYSSICNIGSRIEGVSMKDIYYYYFIVMAAPVAQRYLVTL